LNTAREHAHRKGVTFELESPSRPVQRVLEITALWSHLCPIERRFEGEAFQW
jgi:hypothetical protein